MAESRIHRDLVNLIFDYIKNQIIPARDWWRVKVDNGDNIHPRCVVNRFVPDVLCETDDVLVIGEAKSPDDFMRPHSIDQYSSYFLECLNYPQKRCVIVIGVTWELFASAKNYFKHKKIKEKSQVSVVIITNTGRSSEL